MLAIKGLMGAPMIEPINAIKKMTGLSGGQGVKEEILKGGGCGQREGPKYLLACALLFFTEEN